VSNDGLRHLAGLRELRSLNLSDALAIDGRGLAHLRGLPWLRYLMLDATSVGDEGLEYLRELPALERVLLAGTKVTDAGLAGASVLRQVASPSLRTNDGHLTRAPAAQHTALSRSPTKSWSSSAAARGSDGTRPPPAGRFVVRHAAEASARHRLRIEAQAPLEAAVRGNQIMRTAIRHADGNSASALRSPV